MPREKKLSGRLEALLDDVFAERPDSHSLFREIAAELHPEHHLPLQKKIRRMLRARGALATDSALLVASVLALTGFPLLRILHFLSLYVPGTVRLSQFEFAVSAMFANRLPITDTLLYDLTRYTYLEKRLLVRKSMEISAGLKSSLSPEVLLYLYLLSLRDDLSNENVALVGLILKNCFPALEVRSRMGGATLEEYGEMARALRHGEQRSLSLEYDGGAATRAPRPFDRESASFFLDKYFADAALEKQHEEVVAARPVSKAVAVRKAAAGPTPKAAARTATGSVARRGRRPGVATSSGRSQDDAHAGEPAAVPASTAAQAGAPAVLQPRAGAAQAANASVSRPAGRIAPRRPAARALMPAPTAAASWLRFPPLAPLCAAAVVALALTVLAVRVLPLSRAPHAEPAPAVAAPAAAEAPRESPDALQPPAQPPAPPALSYVVQRGDSLWKIYRSLRNDPAALPSWAEFLSRMSAENGIGDPDRIQPGKVLTVQPAQR